MSSLGLIARGDQGGLAAMTWEFARHLRPDRVLLMDLGPAGRGHTREQRYRDHSANVRVCHKLEPSDADLDWLLQVDRVYTAETAYHPAFWQRAKAAGVDTVLHAMPELYSSEGAGPRRRRPPIVDQSTQVWNPTSWEMHRLPASAALVPVPVADDRITPRVIDKVETFFHPVAPAMLDRNGTQLVLAAVEHMQNPCRLVIQGEGGGLADRVKHGVVDVEWVGETENYWTLYNRSDIDALILPRRYGGLSLPMQQAAAAGWPIISLNLEPQNEWLHPDLLAPVHVQHRRFAMKGGKFDVYDSDPKALATIMDSLLASDELTVAASNRSLQQRALLSWERLRPVYERMLG